MTPPDDIATLRALWVEEDRLERRTRALLMLMALGLSGALLIGACLAAGVL